MFRYLLFLLPALAFGQTITYEPLMVPVVNGIPVVGIGLAPTPTGPAPWFIVRSFAPPPYGGRYCIEAKNNAGTWIDTCFNPGVMVGTPGAEQGDVDTDILVDGKTATVAVAGRWASNPPGLQVWPPDLMWIGSVSNRWAGLYMTSTPCPASVPGKPLYCVRNSGGFTPVYGE